MLKTTTILVMAGALAAVASEARAQTQPPPASLGFVNINFGTQPSSRTINTSSSFPVYGETATLTSTQENGSGAVFDIGGGYRFQPKIAGYQPNLGAGIAFSRFSNTSDSAITAVVPNPLIFDLPRTTTANVPDLKHSENGVHLQVLWFLPITNQVDVALSVGPSFISVRQDIVSSFTVPAGTQNATPVVTSEKKTGVGINLGLDGTYLFTRNFGAGAYLRYAGAKVDLPTVADLKVGGFQVGVGGRVRF
jgi:hypothetical protein